MSFDGVWPSAPLEEICARITSGGTPARARADLYYTPAGHKWVKTKELRDAPIDDTEEHITAKALEESSAKLLPVGTILMAMYGAPTVGQLGFLRSEAACNQACCALVVDPEVADARFVFYALLRARAEIINGASGSAQQNTSAALIKKLKIPLPSVDAQRRIARVLSALDDRIEHSRGLRSTLDAAVTRIAAECVAGVTDEHPLDTLARFVNGKAFTKHASGFGRPILRIKELNSGLSDATPCAEIDADDDNIAKHHDLLFSWSGTLDVYRWDGPESLINQHIFKVVPNNGYPLWLLEYWTRQHLERFRVIAKDKAVTMGHIRREDLSAARVLVPSPDRLRRARELGNPLDAMRGAIASESRRLAAIRDTLLPKLVSGEIRVPDSYDPDDVLGTVAEAAGVAAP